MPRASLPPALKNLRLFDVVLTQHTEEDLLAFYYKELPEFERIGYKMIACKDRCIGKLMEKNPYEKVNWKSAQITPKIEFDWADGNEWLEEKLSWIAKFRHDIILLDRVFQWEQTNDGFRSMMYDVEKVISQNMHCDHEFETMNALCYKSAYEAWKKQNHAYLEAKKLAHEHEQGEHSIAYWEHMFPAEHPEFYIQYIKPKVEKCKACANAIQADLDRKELEQMQKKEREEEHARELAKKASIQEVRSSEPRMTYACETCAFTTEHKSIYDRHMTSREHTQKQNMKDWHCTACNIQSRTAIEHAHHISTKKHRENIGEIEKDPDVFKCDACQYSTPLKQVFQRHCNSKAHLLKISGE